MLDDKTAIELGVLEWVLKKRFMCLENPLDRNSAVPYLQTYASQEVLTFLRERYGDWQSVGPVDDTLV